MAITSLGEFISVIVELDWRKFNHLRQATAIKFVRQSSRSVISVGTGSCQLKNEARSCPYRKLNPDVLVMQSAQDWHQQSSADGLDRAGYRRILIQG